MSCSDMPPLGPVKCSRLTQRNDLFVFKNYTCIKNGKMFGKVLHSSDKTIMVEIDNGNKYMNGQIVFLDIF